MASAHEKGSVLEMAVRAIEHAILATAPGYNEKTFRIEQRKIISVNGVHHEIDIWVGVDVAPGYEAVFIFECRNRENKVDKNDIIVFTEKIKAARAQKGFFVAKSFTGDAEAQARLDSRIGLLRVTDFPLDGVPLLRGVRGVDVEETRGTFQFIKRGARDHDPRMTVDVESAQWRVDGVSANLKDYLNTWLGLEREGRANMLPSGIVEEGVHEVGLAFERAFEVGTASLNGADVELIRFDGHLRVRLTRPVLMSYFDVATRGRAVTARLKIGNNAVNLAFVLE
jgi:hypothetical protein